MSKRDRGADLSDWAARHWISVGVLTGVAGALWATVVTWQPAVGIPLGILFGLLNTWIWRPGGPMSRSDGLVSRWNERLRRRFPPDS